MWQWLQDRAGAVLPIGFEAMSDAEKVNAIAAFSQTLAAILALMALLLSLWVFSRQQKLNRWQLRLHREDHIIAWVRMCLGVLAEIEEAASCHDGAGTELLPKREFVSLRSRLSALIDEGRLYFPNIESRTHGIGKHAAFRGHRQDILDPLVAFYDQMKVVQLQPGVANDTASIEALNVVRRKFVSAAQAAIDPRRFNRIRA